MKNLFLTKTRWLVTIILLTALGIGNAWGASTKTFTTTSSGGFSNNSKTIAPITVTMRDGTSNKTSWQATHVRVYTGGGVTISSSDGNIITKIEFTCTASGTSSYGPSKQAYSIDKISYGYSGYVGTWTGSATEVVMNATAQIRFTQIVVTYEPVCTGTQLGTPVVTATPSDGQVILSWPDVSNASSYQLKWNGGKWVAATSPVTKTELTNGTSYTYQVKAIGNGSTYCDGDASEEASVTPNVFRTITYYDKDGQHTTSLADGTNIADALNALYGVSDPTSCDAVNYGYFVGWKVGEISGTASSVTLLDDEVVNASSPSNNYYAVWSDTDPASAGVWTKVGAGELAVGDKVVFVYAGATNKEMTGVASNLGTATSITTIPDDITGVYVLTVEAGNGGSGYSFKNGSNYLSYSGSSNNLYTSTEKNNNSSWTISTSTDGNYKFANVGTTSRILQYNSGNPRWACYTSSQSAFQIYKQSAGGDAEYITTCCTALGSINGSVSLSQLTTPDPTKLKASWTMNAETGIASYTLEVYGSSNNLVKTINKYTSGSEITGLTPCTEYYVKLYTVSSGGEYCEGGLIGTSSSVTTNSYTLTVNKSNVTLSNGSEPTNICSDISATYAASDGYTLPTSISVTNAGAENTDWTWNSSTGVLTINKANVTGNVMVTITGAAQSNFINGETVFIQADSKDYSAWKDDACVKAWFNNNWSGGSAETTYWLFDATDADAGKKLFATVVPASGDLNIVQLQRFAGNCLNKWNDNGSVNKASSNGVNTFRSYGSADNNVAWNGSSTILYLYGSQNSWESSLGTFADQGAGVWTATISNYTPDATSKDYKIKTSYNNGWIGNTGSNNNATLSDMIVGSTYNVTATLNVTTHALTMSKTFVKGTVHFDQQGHGSAIADLTNVAAGSKISAPSPAPNETGWDFGGWYKEAGCTNAWNFVSDEVTETMTLYAKWTKKSYTITSTLNNVTSSPAIPTSYEYTGSAADLSYTITPSSGYRLPTTITVTGTTHTWDPATGALVLTGTITNNVTITISAVQTHTVTWKVSGNADNEVVYDHGDALVLPSNPSAPTACSEKRFVGWKEGAIDGSTDDRPTMLNPSNPGTVTADKTYYAVFADEGTTFTKVTDPSTFMAGDKIAIVSNEKSYGLRISSNAPAATANIISDAATITPAADQVFTLAGNSTDGFTMSTASRTSEGVVTLGAASVPNSNASANVSLNSSNNTWKFSAHNTSNCILISPSSKSTCGLEYFNSSWLIYNKTGGVASTAACAMRVYRKDLSGYVTTCSECMTPSDLEVSAITSTGATVTWAGVSQTQQAGGSGTGYKVAWNTSNSVPSPLNASNSADVAAGTNSYAITGLTAATQYYVFVQSKCDDSWSSSTNFYTNAKITYAAGAGSGSMDPKEVTYNTDAIVDACTFTAPSGKKFNGWVSDQAVTVSGGSTTSVPDGATITGLTKAITLTAQWRDLASYTVNFSADNGTVAGGTVQTVYEEGKLTFPNVTSTTCGTFIGWVEAAYDNTAAPSGVTFHEAGSQIDVLAELDGNTYYAVYRVATGMATNINDELTADKIGTTSYSDWSELADASAAIYAGNSTKSTTYSNSIQIRNSNSSGIVTTTSGGLAKKVTFNWVSGNTSGRIVDIYGKNSAYSSAADLYSTDVATQGTKIGSITYNSTTELTISTDYEYIGIRANNGAAYIGSITIQWYGAPMKYQTSPTCSPMVGVESNFSTFTYAYNAGPSASQSFTVSGSSLGADLVVTAPANYEVCKTADGTYTSTIRYTPSDGAVANTTAYIRLAAGLNVGTYNYAAASGLQVTSTGAKTRTAALNGTVTKADCAITFTDFNAGDHYEATLEYGSSVTVSYNYTYNGDGNFSISRSPATGKIDKANKTLTVSVAGIWTLNASATAGTNYSKPSDASAQIRVKCVDTYKDFIHNKTIKAYGSGTAVTDGKMEDWGNGYTVPYIEDNAEETSGSCQQTHYKFMGWVSEDDINIADGTFKTGWTLIQAGTESKLATTKTYYAVWAKLEE